MFINTEALIKACENLKLEYKTFPNSNLVEVRKAKSFYFVNNSVPLNDESTAFIAKDKDFTYKILDQSIKIPKTIQYLDPNCPEKYREYLTFLSIEEIIQDIKTNFNFPLIIKRNAGSTGNNVFLCNSLNEVESSLKIIFDEKSMHYDYIALAQEYINIKFEYRVVCLDSKIEFMYLKDNHDAKFVGNLSPLHYEGARAVLIKDENLIERIQEFINPIFKKIDIRYTGLDVGIDINNEVYLLEVNSKPGFEYFVADNGSDVIVRLYENILKLLI